MTFLNALLVDEVRKHPNGRVDLIGLYEDIFFPELPITLESISLFLDLQFADADRGQRRTLELRLIGPDGALVQNPPTQIKFVVPREDEYARDTAQLDLALFETTFRTYGTHRIDIVFEDAIVRSLPLRILPADR